jgi:hypothetical protein
MYKSLTLLLCSLLFWHCNSSENSTDNNTKKTTPKADISILHLDNFQPKAPFDNCLELGTYQLLASAEQHLEDFIETELLSEDESLNTGYQRFVEEWTGETFSEMNTEKLLDDNFANALYAHPNFDHIWIPLSETGDTVYTEEVAYDENGNGVIVRYIENYLTLNKEADYYRCLKNEKDGFIQSYLVGKEYGEVEPQNFAAELLQSLDYEQFDDAKIQQIIVSELYLRIIALRKGQ